MPLMTNENGPQEGCPSHEAGTSMKNLGHAYRIEWGVCIHGMLILFLLLRFLLLLLLVRHGREKGQVCAFPTFSPDCIIHIRNKVFRVFLFLSFHPLKSPQFVSLFAQLDSIGKKVHSRQLAQVWPVLNGPHCLV